MQIRIWYLVLIVPAPVEEKDFPSTGCSCNTGSTWWRAIYDDAPSVMTHESFVFTGTNAPVLLLQVIPVDKISFVRASLAICWYKEQKQKYSFLSATNLDKISK
jgi:hypothetical protein